MKAAGEFRRPLLSVKEAEHKISMAGFTKSIKVNSFTGFIKLLQKGDIITIPFSGSSTIRNIGVNVMFPFIVS